TPAQYKAFRKLAKKEGILFAAASDKDGKGKLFDVILPATEVDRANRIFERILYNPNLGPESPEPPQEEKKPHWWQKIFHRRDRDKDLEADAEPDQETPEMEVIEMSGGPVPELGTGKENPTNPGPEVIIVAREDVIITPQPITPESLPPEATPPGLPEHMEPIRTVDAELPKEETERPEGAWENAAETKTGTEPMQESGREPPRSGRESGEEPPLADPGDARPSPPDSQDSKDKLTENTSSAKASPPMTEGRSKNEKPSVLQRLAAYKAQIDAKDAKEKDKQASRKVEKNPTKGGKRVADRKADLPKPAGKGGKRLKPSVR
ncbi:MAG: DUF3801 domain-containing protein, partial [Abditibacteriota bacterium]|nr:DUF3801 domain-containing protein [Abditibacteriota bacterium]